MLVFVVAPPAEAEPGVSGRLLHNVVPLQLEQFLRSDQIRILVANHADQQVAAEFPEVRTIARLGVPHIEGHHPQCLSRERQNQQQRQKRKISFFTVVTQVSGEVLAELADVALGRAPGI